LLIRLSKTNNQAQFVSKINEWGKIHVPSKFVDILELRNHEPVLIQLISKNKRLQLSKGVIDLSGIGTDVIPREEGYITIYTKRKRPVTLPGFIEITPVLLELFFLIHGDGHYKTKLFFVNKAPELHAFVLEQFENILKIPKSLWKARLLISNTEHEEEAKSYWKHKLNLNEDQFYNTSKTALNTDEHGNLRIIIDKTLVALIFRYIFANLDLNKERSLHALNGLLYAEGGAQISNVGLHKITLSFNQQEKNMFKGILDRLGLNYKIEQNRNFVISGWINHYMFFKTFLSNNAIPFRIHPRRGANAITGFLKHSFTKTLTKYIKPIKPDEILTLNELSKRLKIRTDSVTDTITKPQYSVFINLKRIRAGYTISITKEGEYFLQMVKRMEELSMNEKLPFERIERHVLTKREAETNPSYGKKPEERTVKELLDYGVINLNKPDGPT